MTDLSVIRSGWTNFHRVHDDAATADSVTNDLIDILDTVDVPIVVVLRDFTIACFNRAAAEVLRLAPADVGQSPRDIPVFSGLPDLEEWCGRVNGTGAPCRRDFREGEKSFVVRIAPYPSSGHQITSTVLTFTNVTAFRASIDQAIYEREYTKAILNTVPDPLVVLGADLRVQSGNRAFYATFQLSREQTQHVPLYELASGTFDLDRLRTQLQETVANSTSFQPFEIDHQFPGIGPRTLMLDARQLSLPGHSGRMVLLAFQDITERKKAEQTQRLLLGEMEHRVKNTLAMVQAIATQTLRQTPIDERAAFVGRLHALSNAHDLLKQENWDRATVGDVVNRALEPFQRERFQVAGSEVWLAVNTSLMLTMAIHELATNAVKYGALSNGKGEVRIAWGLVDDTAQPRLELRWQESDGPPVAPPQHKGFGSLLLARTLDGARVEFMPNGVSCTLEIAL